MGKHVKMYARKMPLFSYLLLPLVAAFLLQATAQQFFGADTSGPFELHVIGINKCAQYPVNALADCNLNLQKISRKDAVVTGSVLVKNNTQTISAKIKNYIWAQGGWKPSFLSVSIVNICELEAIADVLKKFLNANANCEVQKGLYNFTNFYPETSIRENFGDEASYGKTRSEVNMLSGEDPVLCVNMDIEIIPKKM